MDGEKPWFLFIFYFSFCSLLSYFPFFFPVSLSFFFFLAFATDVTLRDGDFKRWNPVPLVSRFAVALTGKSGFRVHTLRNVNGSFSHDNKLLDCGGLPSYVNSVIAARTRMCREHSHTECERKKEKRERERDRYWRCYIHLHTLWLSMIRYNLVNAIIISYGESIRFVLTTDLSRYQWERDGRSMKYSYHWDIIRWYSRDFPINVNSTQVSWWNEMY